MSTTFEEKGRLRPHRDSPQDVISALAFCTQNPSTDAILDYVLSQRSHLPKHECQPERSTLQKAEAPVPLPLCRPNIRAVWAASQEVAERLGAPGPALVTADGAVNTDTSPNEQEAITASLHYCEVGQAFCEGGHIECVCD